VASFPEGLQLRAQKMVCVPSLKSQIEALDDIGAVIFSHGRLLYRNHRV
jgi:hypothetical protein